MPSSISEPSIITLVKPERIAPMHTAGDWPWSWCMHDGDVRVSLDCGQDQVAQEGLAGVLTGAGRALHDDRGVDLVGRFHDGAHLLEVVDVEGGQSVAVLGRVVEQLAHRYEGHGRSPLGPPCDFTRCGAAWKTGNPRRSAAGQAGGGRRWQPRPVGTRIPQGLQSRSAESRSAARDGKVRPRCRRMAGFKWSWSSARATRQGETSRNWKMLPSGS